MVEDVDEQTRWCYRRILLDSLVHELNLLRGALGEPTEVTHAELLPQAVGLSRRFGETPCHLSWVDLPASHATRRSWPSTLHIRG
jgi:hypothetical protein